MIYGDSSCPLTVKWEEEQDPHIKEAIDQAWKVHGQATNQAWKVYYEATAQARKIYEEATAQAWKAFKEARAQAEKKSCKEVEQDPHIKEARQWIISAQSTFAKSIMTSESRLDLALQADIDYKLARALEELKGKKNSSGNTEKHEV